jgi:LytS/YehU family sensor histidine kinase
LLYEKIICTYRRLVNPHFLFNTLNNLYGLAWSKSDLVPQMVLGLPDAMRYLIYETEQKLVPVEKELNIWDEKERFFLFVKIVTGKIKKPEKRKLLGLDW